MTEIKKMYCPSCGAPISFQPGREDTFCSSCGSQLYFKDDHLEVKLKHEEAKMKHEEVKLEYEDRNEEREFQKYKDKQSTKNIILGCVISILILFFIRFWFTYFM